MIPLRALSLPPANDVRAKPLARRSPTAGNQGQGGNWIRKKRRHAIYARDSLPHGPEGTPRCADGPEGTPCCADGGSGALGPVLMPACVWCGRTGLVAGSCADDGATLDHFLAREHGGTNESSNLLTCCFGCNSKRGSMAALEFAGLLSNGDSSLRFVVLERVLTALDRAT